jgi:hypothetical protein
LARASAAGAADAKAYRLVSKAADPGRAAGHLPAGRKVSGRRLVGALGGIAGPGEITRGVADSGCDLMALVQEPGKLDHAHYQKQQHRDGDGGFDQGRAVAIAQDCAPSKYYTASRGPR